MSDAIYALMFALVAAVVSLPPVLALLLYHGIESPFVTLVLVVFAAISAGTFAFYLGRNQSGLLTVPRGILIMFLAFVFTVGVDMVILDLRLGGLTPESLTQLPKSILFFSFFGILGHGWYVLPIGAAVPWAARTIGARRVA